MPPTALSTCCRRPSARRQSSARLRLVDTPDRPGRRLRRRVEPPPEPSDTDARCSRAAASWFAPASGPLPVRRLSTVSSFERFTRHDDADPDETSGSANDRLRGRSQWSIPIPRGRRRSRTWPAASAAHWETVCSRPRRSVSSCRSGNPCWREHDWLRDHLDDRVCSADAKGVSADESNAADEPVMAASRPPVTDAEQLPETTDKRGASFVLW